MQRAFFPGGNGLLLGEDASNFPANNVLVLGSNFGCDEKFANSRGDLLCQDETNNAGTWSGLRKRFSDQQLASSFFTNAWPFLHSGKSNNPDDVVKRRWLRDRVLMDSCMNYFRDTMDEALPSTIVALGKAPAAYLSYYFATTLQDWRGDDWKLIDRTPQATVHFASMDVHCVAITHPSMSNAHNRSDEFNTFESELALLQSALETGRKIAIARSRSTNDLTESN